MTDLNNGTRNYSIYAVISLITAIIPIVLWIVLYLLARPISEDSALYIERVILVFYILIIVSLLFSIMSGIVALIEIKKNSILKGKVLAIIGIVLPIIVVIISIIGFLFAHM